MNKLVEIFCDVDDFCRVFIPQWEKQLITDGNIKRNRPCRMTMSEVITILIAFHTSNHRDFKNYYNCLSAPKNIIKKLDADRHI